MKWKQAKFKITTKKGIKEVDGKVTTFLFGEEEVKIGVFEIYQLTCNEFDKYQYSITELTTGRRIAVVGSLGSATRHINEYFKNDETQCNRFLKLLHNTKKIKQFQDVLN